MTLSEALMTSPPKTRKGIEWMLGYVENEPFLKSLLYDLDLLPEQLRNDCDWAKMAAVVTHWKDRDRYTKCNFPMNTGASTPSTSNPKCSVAGRFHCWRNCDTSEFRWFSDSGVPRGPVHKTLEDALLWWTGHSAVAVSPCQRPVKTSLRRTNFELEQTGCVRLPLVNQHTDNPAKPSEVCPSTGGGHPATPPTDKPQDPRGTAETASPVNPDTRQRHRLYR